MNLEDVQAAVATLNRADQQRLLAWLQRQVDAQEPPPADPELWQPPGVETAQAVRRIGKSCFLLQGVKCGKPGCKCATGALHGPYWYEFWREGGKVRKRYHGKRIKSG